MYCIEAQRPRPAWERLDPPYRLSGDQVYGNMLSVMDRGMANITHELKASGLYDATLIIAFSDNGGPTSEKGPNNYPLRGSKESPWEGGTRVAAFVSGGYLPASLRGTVSHSFVHAADWCECCRCPHSQLAHCWPIVNLAECL